MPSKDDEDGVELHPLVSKPSFTHSDSPPPGSPSPLRALPPTRPPHSERGTKLFVLFLACTFSIGSHYSQDSLGPLKDILKQDLHITDTQMSLILGSHLVANTVLPIVAGVLVARFGTLRSSLVATGVLFLGQGVNLWGVLRGDVKVMILGLCLFG
jgi:MFS family permease